MNMTLNEAQELWLNYESFNEYDKDALNYSELNADYESAVLAEYQKLTGKKTKKFETAAKYVGREKTDEIIKPFQQIMSERIAVRKSLKLQIENELRDFAKEYNIIPCQDLHCVAKSCVSDYHTQGYGASKYAQVKLEDPKLLLEIYGFQTEIRTRKDDYENWYYELWSSLTEFDFWMLNHSGKFISVLNWAVLCWRKGANPKVYFPFLSNEDFENSLVLSRDLSYVITKENCMLEPKL